MSILYVLCAQTVYPSGGGRKIRIELFFHCSRGANNVWRLKTMFEAPKQCLRPWNNVWRRETLFEAVKHCSSGPNIVSRPPLVKYPAMLGRQRTGSVLCPSCGKLVGVNDEVCLNCGRKRPGMWGLTSLVRGLGKDLGFVQAVIVGNAFLYVAMLVVDPAPHPDGGPVLDRRPQPGEPAPVRRVRPVPGLLAAALVDPALRRLAPRRACCTSASTSTGSASSPPRPPSSTVPPGR